MSLPHSPVGKLNQEVNAALADPRIRNRLRDMDGTALTGSSADFGKLIINETEKWAKLVKLSGAKAIRAICRRRRSSGCAPAISGGRAGGPGTGESEPKGQFDVVGKNFHDFADKLGV